LEAPPPSAEFPNSCASLRSIKRMVLQATDGTGRRERSMFLARATLICLVLLPSAALAMAGERAADLPPGALARIGSSALRHGSAITAVAFSADGKLLASSDNDRSVRLWDPSTGLARGVLDVARPVQHLAFHRASNSLITGDQDGDILF